MHRALVIGTVLGLPLMIAALVLGPAAFDLIFHRQAPGRFLIPSGYRGCARIECSQKEAAPLPIENGRTLLKLDDHGSLRTSSNPPSLHGKDEFFYYSGERRTPLSNAGVCKGGMVCQIETMVDQRSSVNSTPFVRFFVGTEA